MTQEAMKLALGALEMFCEHGAILRPIETRNAIKEALAQPQQEPVTWKPMPRKATYEMLKAMDECSMEGYDERLYAGHASSVYMAAWDSFPEVKHELNCVCGAIWEGDELVCTSHQSAQPQQEPVAYKPVAWLGFNPRTGDPEFAYNMPAPSVMRDFKMRPMVYGDTSPPQRKPLTDEEITAIIVEMNGNEPTAPFWRDLSRAIEAAHNIKE